MDKFEAKKLLKDLDIVQEFLKDKDLPQLERQLSSEVETLKKEDYDIWINSIPDSVKEIMYKKLMPEEMYDVFFPSLLHSDLSKNEIILVFSILKSEKEIDQCTLENSGKLNDLKVILQFIVENDRSKFLSIFQNPEVKQKLLRAKEFAEKNKNLISNILFRKRNEWDEIAESFEGLDMSLKDDRQIYLAPFVNQNTETLNEDKFFSIIQEFLKNQTNLLSIQSKNGIEESVRDIWEELKKEELAQQLNSFSIEMLKKRIKNEQIAAALNDFNSVEEIIKLSVNDIVERYDLSVQQGTELLKQAKDIRNKLKSNVYPKLTLDKLKGKRLQLLHLLNVYRNYPNDQAVEEKVVLENYKQLEEKLNSLESIAPNRYLTNSISSNSFEYWRESEKEIYRIIDGCIRVNRTFKNYLKDNLNDQEIKALFEKDSATFYALIEEITGNKKNYNPSDLPDYIVQEVQKTKLDLKGFKAHLRSYQDFGSKYIFYFQKTLLGDEMGLGKTIQALAVATHLSNQGKNRCLVVSPLSVLENWRREIEKWTNLKCFVFRGNKATKEQNLAKWEETGGILLTNYSQCGILKESREKIDFDFAIVDEAHLIKNPSTKRSKNVNDLIKNCDYKLLMTGTALENRINEMFNLIELLNKSLAEKVANNLNNKTYKTDIAQVYLRRKRKEVLHELPALSFTTMWSTFNDEEQVFYDQAIREGTGAGVLMKMRRAAFIDADSQKIKQIIDICIDAHENNEKVLVFSFFKYYVLQFLKKHLPYLADDIISGDLPPNQRQEVIDIFSKNPKQNVLLVQIDAGGFGLNIQAANRVILCEPQWKPSTENQAISRAYRMGQNRNVMVYRLLTKDSVDETMMEIIHKKEDIFNTYANDSAVADAFMNSDSDKEENEEVVKKKVFQIERERLEKKQEVVGANG
ncbi:DEAD/DEAH box helicase [Lactobacillus hominis]|uniref:Superfamily II DNA/RNA helicase, SNF2 family n=1 Tax=Lactobacillus hominis DSM 23910 = CRBIP 24.179 TaxID=1423758 RepID=I7JU49_9LACO|nr:DEAD/DEAH box helicase [Lactobacillus hominis]KRM86066.1 SNF2 family DNA RNA helicase [Lactobacillus hominis DSM 23910 = CRBIP 24.179]CCI80976.1 Superfamily II DNA/RNA helicase, SNF2 family [Lactobacillus hominis DSM 23910 = CRBIP 24.179]